MVIKSLNYVDYAIIALYLLSMVALGFFAGRGNKNDDDYFRGGNRIPWVMAGLSVFIGQLSAYMFVAASGQAYLNGPAAIVLYIGGFPVLLLVSAVFAHRWRRTRINNPMEYIRLRYGRLTEKFYTLVQVPILVLFLGNFLYILCIFLTAALNLQAEYNLFGWWLGSLELAIIVTGIIITLYTSCGGLWAVVITDTVQFLIVMVASLVIVVLSLVRFGQDGGLVAAAQDFIAHPPTSDYLNLAKPGQPLYFTLAWFLLSLIVYPTEYGTVQRCFSVPAESDARKTTMLAAVSFLVAPIIWLAPIIILRKQMPDLTELWPQLNNPAEASYVTISLALLPNGLIGLTLSAILAATMSTMSTVYNVVSSILTENVYKPLRHAEPSPKQTMQAGKMITVVLGALSIIIGIWLSKGSSAFETTFQIASYLQIAVAFPLLMGILVKRVYRMTAILSSVVCLVVTVFIGAVLPRIVAAQYDMHLSAYALFGLKVAAAVVVSGLIYLASYLRFKQRETNEETVEAFFKRLKTPVADDAAGVVRIPDLAMYKYVAWALAFYGAVLLLIHIAGLVRNAGWYNLLTAMIFLMLAAVILWLISPNYSPIRVVRRIPGRDGAVTRQSKMEKE